MLETKLWRKAISPARDAMQSMILVWTVGPVLLAACIVLLLLLWNRGFGGLALRAGIVSLTFGIVVWVLRAATPMAAFCGGMICLLVIGATEAPRAWPEVYSGLTPLMVLFVLTFLATRAGKARKLRAGLAESRKGRNAAQVIANLGAAGLVAVLGAALVAAPQAFGPLAGHLSVSAMLLAVLGEATADTVSSEIGQAFGGTPFLITTLRRVPAGTDGAFSLPGTLAGMCAAVLVVAAGGWSLSLPPRVPLMAFAASFAGLFFDSLLGATVERRGWLGNDLVNFSSTVFAGLVALALAAV